MLAARSGWVIPLITNLSVIGLASPSTAVQLDRTTVIVTVAEANAHCLVETKTMSLEKAQTIASGFLAAQQISDVDRSAVTRKSNFTDLMASYIADQGGCRALVKELKR